MAKTWHADGKTAAGATARPSRHNAGVEVGVVRDACQLGEVIQEGIVCRIQRKRSSVGGREREGTLTELSCAYEEGRCSQLFQRQDATTGKASCLTLSPSIQTLGKRKDAPVRHCRATEEDIVASRYLVGIERFWRFEPCTFKGSVCGEAQGI